MRALGLEGSVLFGASQGGMIAMEIAARHPDLVRALGLGSTAARMPQSRCGAVDRWIKLAREGNTEALYLDFAEAIYPENVFHQYRDTFVALSRSVTEADLKRFIILAEGMHGFDDLDLLPLLACPVLLLGSRDDAVLGADAFSEIQKKLSGRSGFCSHLYDGFGHASFDTAPDYLSRILTFLNSI